jgi:predicted alpha/beta superfamily hydrolase
MSKDVDEERRFFLRAGAAVAASAFLPRVAQAQYRPSTAERRIFAQEVASHTLNRFPFTTADGSEYQIFRANPRGPAPAGGFPVLYMLDGNAAFEALDAELLKGIPGLVVIGVGYNTDLVFETTRRALDYTPPPGGGAPAVDPRRRERPAGGAPLFLPRLAGELRGAAEAGLAIDGARRTLWGHSYGGLFTFYALLHAPDGFARYAAISPPVSWGDGAIGKIEAEAVLPEGLRRDVLMAYGGSERRPG